MSTWQIIVIVFLAWVLLSGLGIQCRGRQTGILEDADLLGEGHFTEGLTLGKLLFFLFGSAVVGLGALVSGPKRFALNSLLADIDMNLLTVAERRKLDAAITKYCEE